MKHSLPEQQFINSTWCGPAARMDVETATVD